MMQLTQHHAWWVSLVSILNPSIHENFTLLYSLEICPPITLKGLAKFWFGRDFCKVKQEQQSALIVVTYIRHICDYSLDLCVAASIRAFGRAWSSALLVLLLAEIGGIFVVFALIWQASCKDEEAAALDEWAHWGAFSNELAWTLTPHFSTGCAGLLKWRCCAPCANLQYQFQNRSSA